MDWLPVGGVVAVRGSSAVGVVLGADPGCSFLPQATSWKTANTMANVVARISITPERGGRIIAERPRSEQLVSPQVFLEVAAGIVAASVLDQISGGPQPILVVGMTSRAPRSSSRSSLFKPGP
jgi:hypothetical protein